LYSSLINVGIIKVLLGHERRVGEVRNAYIVLARKLQAKRLLDPGVDGRIMNGILNREVEVWTG
jgi:hypothetical protein